MNILLHAALQKFISVFTVNYAADLLDEKVGCHYVPDMTDEQQDKALKALETRLAEWEASRDQERQYWEQQAANRRERREHNAEIDRRRAAKLAARAERRRQAVSGKCV